MFWVSLDCQLLLGFDLMILCCLIGFLKSAFKKIKNKHKKQLCPMEKIGPVFFSFHYKKWRAWDPILGISLFYHAYSIKLPVIIPHIVYEIDITKILLLHT